MATGKEGTIADLRMAFYGADGAGNVLMEAISTVNDKVVALTNRVAALEAP